MCAGHQIRVIIKPYCKTQLTKIAQKDVKMKQTMTHTNTSTEQERAEFERWARDEFYNGMACASETWDEQRRMYNDAAHHMAFKAWQAAQACEDKGIK